MSKSAGSELGDSDRSLFRQNRIRLLLLGLNAWLIISVLPIGLSDSAGWTVGITAVLSLVLLALGVFSAPRSYWIFGQTDPTAESLPPPIAAYRITRWALLAGFPTSLALTVALRGHASPETTYDEAGLMTGAIAMLVFFLGSAAATNRPYLKHQSSHEALSSALWVRIDRRRLWLRRSLLMLGAIGAWYLVVVAPLLSPKDARAHWGEAATEARLLCSVAGTVLGVTVLIGFVGPMMRKRRGAARATPSSVLRLVVFASTAALGAVAWWWIAR